MKSHLAAILVAVVVAACAPATTPSPSPTESETASSPRPSTDAEPTPSIGQPTPDLAWYGLPQADDLLRGAAIASLAAGRLGFVVLGTDRDSGGLLSWTSPDGDGWVRHWLPGESFGGGSPDRVVGGDFGYLAAGWRLDGSTFSRALWASPDGVSWSPAPTEGLPPGDVAGLAAGPAGIVVLIERGERDTLIAASNDGRRWQLGESPPGLTVHHPDDLVALRDGFLLVGSIQSLDASGVIQSERGAWRSADGLTWMRSPAATGDLAGDGRWVEVTGHYDDPISPTCRYAGYDGSIGLEPEPQRAMAVLTCRLHFVVTDLRTTR